MPSSAPQMAVLIGAGGKPNAALKLVQPARGRRDLSSRYVRCRSDRKADAKVVSYRRILA